MTPGGNGVGALDYAGRMTIPTATDAAAALFAPPAGEWRRLSPRYATVRRLQVLIASTLFFVPVGVAAWLLLRDWWAVGAVAALGLAWLAWRLVRAGRWVRAWGYAERDADLCIRSGLWTRNLTIIPFGRMQMVKVQAGPLLRAFGLASVELVTASALTNATISGLPADEATALRDRLIELSDARDAGL